VRELPIDLVVDDFRPVGSRQADGFDGICRGTKCVRAHMTNGHRLTGGSGSSNCRGSLHFTGGDTTDESAANLLGCVQLTSGERASAGDKCPRADITWSLSLK
jgi:hypothetical protein